MAEGVLVTIAESLVTHLASSAIKEIALAWGFHSRLKRLQQTVNTIKDVLLDAEERQLHSHTVRGWVQRLKVVVYEADDLFDEFSTMVLQKKDIHGNKFTREVTSFFSSTSNQIKLAFSISSKIKNIKEKLDGIDQDGKQFAFVIRPYHEEQRIVYRKEHESYSFVDVEEVVGRKHDRKSILDILDGYPDQRVCVVPIVGMGGLGKTTLAQLVYNELQKGFDLRMWVCVSDHFDLKEMVTKILKSATNVEPQNLELDQLQKELQSQINRKKYLLVLDDVWNEDTEKWHKLSALLRVGMEGSKIIVTTRLMKVAEIMGTIPNPYVLKGLSKEKSLILFKRMAFPPGQEEDNPELLSIVVEVVRKCANVPLAIRVLGSLLRGKDKHAWLNMKDRSLADIPENGNHIMGILEVSYRHLNSSLKNCFAYCALFQKDFELKKRTLINLWMAQGFVIPAHRSQSLEEAGEEYFLTLLHMGFFQDTKRDDLGNIKSCKMHDLFHDLAVNVTGIECKVAELEGMDQIDERTNHLSIGKSLTASLEVPSTVLNLKLLRTFLLPHQKKVGSTFSKSLCDQLLLSSRCLRVLDLHNLELEALPSSIGNLIHLRYLSLSHTSIKVLPDSITKLQNLQTLDLNSCQRLEILPADLGKLSNLRTLDFCDCPSLTEVPSGLGGLTSLHSLPFLRVKKILCHASESKAQNVQLGDLKNLNLLGGSLEIVIEGVLKDPAYESSEANMSSKDRLIELRIKGDREMYKEASGSSHDEAVLEGLKPHSNLKKLEIIFYNGEKLPSWADMDNLRVNLPNLVKIKLSECLRCQRVPSFSQLPFLKELHLEDLQSVEYMECELPVTRKKLFFPSLEILLLVSMDNLKGWWIEVGDDVEVSPAKFRQPSPRKSFSNLSELMLCNCPNLKSVPHCPKVEVLDLLNVNENLLVLKMAGEAPSTSTSFMSSSKLRRLTVSSVRDLISLPKECVSSLVSLDIDDADMVNTSSIGEFFGTSNFLLSLVIQCCGNLTSISIGLENLTMLETLSIANCRGLDMQPSEYVKDDMPWIALRNLRTLSIAYLRKLTALPTGFQHLPNLRSLEIIGNNGLEALPEWIGCLTSLEQMELIASPKLSALPEGFRKLTTLSQLIIHGCPGLTQRCRGPTGEDWPKIQHIPFVSVLADWSIAKHKF